MADERRSQHSTAAAWICGLILIPAMTGGGLFALAWHDAQAFLEIHNPTGVNAAFDGIGLRGQTPVLMFEVVIRSHRLGVHVEWQLWPFRQMRYLVK